ncbi:class I glutamine amidotransferase-like protein [Suhomyces tanzawaensis NRRL Y-17324]|uniref:D-lactate dehydratase n=1 Tax=Suhomyces tanzawaensis NRRL Y-17324 TaxID=984487 RepID=A0A1E4SG45_9ASCO|nr:class I glutamine amidotransferase-like protein [Suhomyces tanzawaensis NRRL Y-17324]ODV78440.1 class I glutamine amidotransferase-like protein [Suhomyces tanzawaensis NRRL Y-17324]
MVKALIAVTSFFDKFYPDGTKTGLFAAEAIEPFEIFRAEGYEVDFVSETGTFGYDENSVSNPDFLNGEIAEIFHDKESAFNKAMSNIKKAADVKADEYDIFYAAGGHGTLEDFPTASGLQSIALAIWAKEGVVAALCHGVAILANLLDSKTGKPLAQGKSMTGFTDEGERLTGVDKLMEARNLQSIEDWATKLGANYVAPPTPFEDFVVNDGKFVTGVNPASAKSTAIRAVEVYKN